MAYHVRYQAPPLPAAASYRAAVNFFIKGSLGRAHASTNAAVAQVRLFDRIRKSAMSI
jgi:hypothetical protein